MANFLGVYARGLCAHYVLAVFKAQHRQTRMLIVRYGNQYRVARIALDKIFTLGEYLNVGQLLNSPLTTVFLAVRNSGYFNFRALAGHDVLDMAAAHVAYANYTKPYLIHCKLPPIAAVRPQTNGFLPITYSPA